MHKYTLVVIVALFGMFAAAAPAQAYRGGYGYGYRGYHGRPYPGYYPRGYGYFYGRPYGYGYRYPYLPQSYFYAPVPYFFGYARQSKVSKPSRRRSSDTPYPRDPRYWV